MTPRRAIPLLAVLAAAGVLAATALANHGTSSLTCGQPAHISFDSFPDNGHPNTVSYTVKRNGVTVDAQTRTFMGSSAGFDSVVVSSGLWQITTQWSTNGVSGSSDSGAQTLTCASPTTVTVRDTVTDIQTVTVPQTVTNTRVETVTRVDTQTVVNTVTLPAQTVTATVTLPAPPAWVVIRTVTRWVKCPPARRKPPTARMKCLAGHANGDFWANGRCYFRGKG